MSFRTETALAFAPGIIFGELDGGGMMIDRNNGEYVPADQLLKDPDRLSKIDILDEDNCGCLRWDLTEMFIADDDADTDTDEEVDDTDPVPHFRNDEEELMALIASQNEDMGVTYTTSNKGRHTQLSHKSDGIRHQISRINGSSSRNAGRKARYKDPRCGQFRTKQATA